MLSGQRQNSPGRGRQKSRFSGQPGGVPWAEDIENLAVRPMAELAWPGKAKIKVLRPSRRRNMGRRQRKPCCQASDRTRLAASGGLRGRRANPEACLGQKGVKTLLPGQWQNSVGRVRQKTIVNHRLCVKTPEETPVCCSAPLRWPSTGVNTAYLERLFCQDG